MRWYVCQPGIGGVLMGSVFLQTLLLIPWLARSEQPIVYPEGLIFRTPAEQADWVRAWVEKRTGFPSDFDIKFYPGMLS